MGTVFIDASVHLHLCSPYSEWYDYLMNVGNISSMSKLKLAIGISVVAAAGILTGLLIAPQKGKKLRKKLKRNCAKFFNDMIDKYSRETEDVEEKSPTVGF